MFLYWFFYLARFDWAGPKTDFQGFLFFLKGFKIWVHKGRKSDIMLPTYATWVPPNFGLSQFETGFWLCQNFASQFSFWPHQFWSVESYFLHFLGHTLKITLLFCTQKLVVGSWHVLYMPGGNMPNSSTIHLSGPNLVPNSWFDI